MEAEAVISLWVCNEVEYGLGVIQRHQVSYSMLCLCVVQRKKVGDIGGRVMVGPDDLADLFQP